MEPYKRLQRISIIFLTGDIREKRALSLLETATTSLSTGVISSTGESSQILMPRHEKRQVSLRSLRRKNLAIDGYNVLITIESALSGRPLISSNDGFIRDISGLSGNFRKTSTDEAIQRILDALREAKPRHALFLFDAPISKSGLLAREIREILKDENLSGDARAVKVPEKTLIGFPGIVATSDTAIIDQSPRVMDLAGHIIRNRIKPESLLKLKI